MKRNIAAVSFALLGILLHFPSTYGASGGISSYSGLLSGTYTDEAGDEWPIEENLIFDVNWLSNKIFGLIVYPAYPAPGSTPLYMFGDVGGDSINDIHIFGPDDGDPGVISFISGSGSGSFSGSAQEFFTITGSGSNFNIQPSNQPSIGSWSVSSSGALSPDGIGPITSPTGTELWEGYFVGIAEDMSNPSSNRRYFMNLDQANFQLGVNKSAGTISGTMSGIDTESAGMINNVIVGGTYGSAYVLDDAFAAKLGCSTNDCIQESVFAAGLKTHGNYLITGDPAKQPVVNYGTPQEDVVMTWGYWEMAFEDPVYNEQYHAHVPSTLWLSGERTSPAVVSDIKVQNKVGIYTGFARGSMIESGMVTEVAGYCSVTVDFGKLGVAADAVTAYIALYRNYGLPTQVPEVILTGTSGSISNAGISGFSNISATSFTNGGILDGKFNGSFYGSNAEGAGGNFFAEFPTKTFIGVFAGTGGNLGSCSDNEEVADCADNNCNGLVDEGFDFSREGDIDGEDLANLITQGDFSYLDDFAAVFGRSGCN